MHRLTRALTALAFGLLFTGLLAPSALATYPGRNGRIVYGDWEEPEVSLVTRRPDGSGLDVLTSGAAYHNAAFSPNGRWIVALRGKHSFNAHTIVLMRADGTRKRIVKATDPMNEVYGLSFTPNGKRILYTMWNGTRGKAFTIRRDGSGQRRILENLDGDLFGVTQSPNGRRYAFGYWAPGRDRGSIYTARGDGTGLRRLTRGQSRDGAPDWSPDSRRLVFTRMTDDFSRVNIMRISASGDGLKRLTACSDYCEAPSWSPDGRKIVYQKHGTADTLRVMSAGGRNDRQLFAGTGLLEPAWQPLPR